MSTETLLLFIIIALAVVVLPAWPYSKAWGYAPIGVLTILLLLSLVWAIAVQRPLFRRTAGDDIRDTGLNVADSR